MYIIIYPWIDHSLEPSKVSKVSKISKELTWKQTSIYDFHDGSNESDYGRFMIDESPKRKKAPRNNTQKRLKRDYDGDVDVLSDVPKNGIEELLKASAYTLGNGAQRLDVTYVSNHSTNHDN